MLIIKAKQRDINVTSIVSTTIRRNNNNYPALKFIFDGAISQEDFDALLSGEISINGNNYEGYTTLSEVSMCVGKITTAEEERDNLEAKNAELKENVAIILPKIDDETALSVKSLFPSFDEVIDMIVKEGFRFTYKDKLYKVIQPELQIYAHNIPGVGTESLYAVINETNAGTIDDPIPYSGNMALENGKYYSQDGVIYYCNRDTGNPVYNPLSELIGLYVVVYEA